MKTQKSDFPQFFHAYLVAALWSSTIPEGEEEKPGEREGDPFDIHFTPDDFTEDALETLHAHALSFWSRMWFFIDNEDAPSNFRSAPRNVTQAGHDFWLTQNDHGAGFWDGDWPKYGNTFTKLAKCYPEMNLCIVETEDGDKVGV